MANMQLGENFGLAKTNAKFTRQNFGIADMSIVINLLTKLYSNPKRTLTQEYISNARDANREVKSKKPIEITAPSKFNPVMKIRDFGPGLSPERINSVFLLYGASTKRNDDKQTGGFGIGAKSAWSYVDSFTIVTYLDGIKRTYIAHKSSGNGNLDLLSEVETNEPNGTEIQVPIRPGDTNEFRSAILRTIFFWNEAEKPVLNGFTTDETSFDSERIKLNDNFSAYKSLPEYLRGNYYRQLLLVIDGIPYSLDSFTLETKLLNDKIKLMGVITIDNGHFHISPSREEIVSDDHNKKLLKDISAIANKAIDSYVLGRLQSHKLMGNSILEFIRLYKVFNIQSTYNGYDINYRGVSLDKSFKVAFTNWEYRGSKLTNKAYTVFNPDDIDHLYYIDSKIESGVKKNFRIRKLLDSRKRIVIVDCDKPTMDKLISELKVKELSTIDASDYKTTKQQSNMSINKKDLCIHEYTGYSLSKKQVKLADLKANSVYAYMDDTIYSERTKVENSELFVYLYTNKINFFFVARSNEKYITSNSNLTHIDAWVKKHKVSENLILKYINSKLYSYFCNLFDLKDKRNEIKNVNIRNILDGMYERTNNRISIPNHLMKGVKDNTKFKVFFTILDNLDVIRKELESKVPLLANSYNTNTDHLVQYINTFAKDTKK